MEQMEANPPIPAKRCSTCRIDRSYDRFYERSTNPTKYPDGYDDICKGCHKWYNRRRYERSKDPNFHRTQMQVPLREHNLSTLKLVMGGELRGFHAIRGRGVNDGLEWTLVMDLTRYDEWKTQIKDCRDNPVVEYKDYLERKACFESFSFLPLKWLWDNEVKLELD